VVRLSIMPFLPRGRGYEYRGLFEFSPEQLRVFHERVKEKRRIFNGRLDVRWLNFAARPLHVVEADGRLILEGGSETLDNVLCHIPTVCCSERG